MRDDANPPNLRSIPNTYDPSSLGWIMRNVELFFQKILAKGPITVSDLTADSIKTDDMEVGLYASLVDALEAAFYHDGSRAMTGDLDVDTNDILNVAGYASLEAELDKALHVDGSRAMTGNLDMGSNSIVNLAGASNASSQVFYYQGNIVGTVSQSGGIPTGEIFETGSDSNGTYIKYADGTQICHRILNRDPVSTTARTEGAITFDYYTDTWTFPSPFVGGNAAITGSAITWGGTIGVGGINIFTLVSAFNVTNTTSLIRVMSGRAFASIQDYSLIAVGRWY